MLGKAFDPELLALIRREPANLLTLGFGAGAVRFAPGTFGTLAFIPLYLLLQPLPLPWYLAATALVFLLGIYLCGRAMQALARHDHPGIVIDEAAGYLVTMAAAPSGILWIVAGFFLFRFFDIVKPWPASVIDRRVRGGLGVMLDDIAAGVYAWACLQGLVWAYDHRLIGG